MEAVDDDGGLSREVFSSGRTCRRRRHQGKPDPTLIRALCRIEDEEFPRRGPRRALLSSLPHCWTANGASRRNAHLALLVVRLWWSGVVVTVAAWKWSDWRVGEHVPSRTPCLSGCSSPDPFGHCCRCPAKTAIPCLSVPSIETVDMAMRRLRPEPGSLIR